MGVVIVQAKATAHVYRLFGALVVLLVLLAIAVGVTRFRSDQRAGSPYGALASVAAGAAPAIPGPPAAPAATATGAPTAPAQPVMAQAAPPVGATPAAAAPLPAGALALAEPSKEPRMIALDKAAAAAPLPQPAPLAVVAAAARAASMPAPAPIQPPPPATATKVALAADTPAAEVKPAPPSGLVNINRASIDQLDHLGGGRIGASIARHRPYRSISDLVSHRVLKARDFARIQSAITAE